MSIEILVHRYLHHWDRRTDTLEKKPNRLFSMLNYLLIDEESIILNFKKMPSVTFDFCKIAFGELLRDRTLEDLIQLITITNLNSPNLETFNSAIDHCDALFNGEEK